MTNGQLGGVRGEGMVVELVLPETPGSYISVAD